VSGGAESWTPIPAKLCVRAGADVLDCVPWTTGSGVPLPAGTGILFSSWSLRACFGFGGIDRSGGETSCLTSAGGFGAGLIRGAVLLSR
jgi:hypothetical protein